MALNEGNNILPPKPAKREPNTNAPMNPFRVLAGLSSGANFFPPHREPIQSPPTSLNLDTATIHTIQTIAILPLPLSDHSHSIAMGNINIMGT
jgi:hypothetical protein